MTSKFRLTPELIAEIEEHTGKSLSKDYEKVWNLLDGNATLEEKLNFSVVLLTAVAADELNLHLRPCVKELARLWYNQFYYPLYEEMCKERSKMQKPND